MSHHKSRIDTAFKAMFGLLPIYRHLILCSWHRCKKCQIIPQNDLVIVKRSGFILWMHSSFAC